MLAKIRRWAGRVPAGLHGSNRPAQERGATLIEYALLLALIAAVAVGSLVFLGQSTTRTLSLTAQKLNTSGGPGGGLPGPTLGDVSDPSGLLATAGPNPGEISLTWNAPTTNTSGYPIIGYDVFRGASTGAESVTPVGTPTITSFPDTGLANATPYWYVVEAVTSIGNSGESNESTATTFGPPSAPTSLAATGGVKDVVLSWAAPTNNNGEPVDGYNIYEGTGPGGESGTPINAALVTGNLYTITGLSDATPYYFTVKAHNAIGLGAASNEATAMTDSVPGAPTALTATAADSQVSLTWTAPPNGGSTITSYEVLEGTAPGAESIVPVGNPTTTSYTATNLNDGTTYYFVVEAVNAVGTGPASTEASATPVAGLPGAPTNLVATPGNGSVGLTWVAPTNNGGCFFGLRYEVFEGTSSGGESATPVNGFPIGGTAYTVTPLTNNTLYYFTVEARCGATNGPASNEASAKPGTPGNPTALTATAGNGSVSLTWTAPVPNGTGPITGYDVFQGTAPGGEGATPVATLGNVTTDSVTPLTNGTTYYFTVEAVNAVGPGAASNEASATPGAPGAPTALKATAGDAQVSLSWTAPGNPGASAITGYDVYDATTAGGEGTTPVNGALVSGTTYTVTGLTDGTRYYFTVEAVNTQGNSGPSNEASTIPVGAPGAPTALTATPLNFGGGNRMELAWTAPANTGGSALTSYNIYEGTTAGGENPTPVDTVTGNFGNPPATNDQLTTGFVTGTKYFFTVEAVNTQGSSGPSNEASATAGTLGAPTNLVATSRQASVRLNWTAPFGFNITAYDVYEGTAPGAEGSAPVDVITTGGPATTATITPLNDGTTYYFTVEAVDATGNSNPSNEAFATPGTPRAPGNLTATAGNGQVILDWTAPFVPPGAPAVTGYEVFDGTSSGGEGSTPADTVGNVLTDTIHGLSNGTTYYFTVAAVNGAGVGPMSNEASAEPGMPPGAPTGLTATLTVTGGGFQYITLNWTAPTSIGTSALTGYNVYEGTTPGGEGTTPVDNVPANQTNDFIFNLNNSQAYYFTVEATNSTGSSGPSNEATATTAGPPGPPTSATASAGPANGQVTVSWTAPVSNGGDAIQNYTVLYGTNPNNLFQNDTTPGAGTTDTIGGLTAGTTYYFEVEANNAIGTSGPSNQANTAPYGPPTAPTNVTTAPASGQVTVSWTAPVYNGGGISDYLVRYSQNQNMNGATTKDTGSTGTSYAVTGLTNGTTYYFEVEAVAVHGTGPFSNPSVAGTPATVPTAPTNVAAAVGPGSGNVTLTWHAPASNGGSAITGYTVLYSQSATMSGANSVNTGSAALNYKVTGLTAGQPYWFEVEAVNVVGTGPNSAPAVSATPESVPAAVTNLAAAAGTGQVVLTWTAPANGGSPIQSYNVLYSTNSAMTGATTVNEPAAGYTVKNLANGTQYWFEVEAVNAIGTGPVSNQATATTTTPAGAPKQPTLTTLTDNGCFFGCNVTVKWTAGPTPPNVTQYQVFEGTSPGGENYGAAVATTNGQLTANVGGLTPGVTYYFTVVAINGSGDSAPSNEKSITP